jgi:hypothetical protein
MGDIRKAYKILVENPEVKRQVGRSRHRLENYIKIDVGVSSPGYNRSFYYYFISLVLPPLFGRRL